MSVPTPIADDRLCDRRQALIALGAAATASLGARGFSAAAVNDEPSSSSAAKADTRAIDDQPLDDVLRQLRNEEPGSRQGLSTHAPMAAEALCSLGYSDQALPWLKTYQAPIRELPRPSQPINTANWREALGPRIGAASWEDANARWGDWKEFFTAELAEKPWRTVLDVWTARLAPGMSGAATHGVIRTAHAVRALARRPSSERMGELARGLAYWASSFETLPARPRQTPGLKTIAEALDETPLYREAFGRSPQGRNIVEVLREAGKFDRFAEVRDLIARPADVSAALTSLTAAFARVYLRYGTNQDTIAFVHAVTGPCSLRRIAPHVAPETARAAFPYAWQTAAAIFSAYVPKRETRRLEESRRSPQELAELAVKSGDEHAIKFTEAMLAEYKINPDPIYLDAADDAIRRL